MYSFNVIFHTYFHIFFCYRYATWHLSFPHILILFSSMLVFGYFCCSTTNTPTHLTTLSNLSFLSIVKQSLLVYYHCDLWPPCVFSKMKGTLNSRFWLYYLEFCVQFYSLSFLSGLWDLSALDLYIVCILHGSSGPNRMGFITSVKRKSFYLWFPVPLKLSYTNRHMFFELIHHFLLTYVWPH